jgi:hypothetical protein
VQCWGFDCCRNHSRHRKLAVYLGMASSLTFPRDFLSSLHRRFAIHVSPPSTPPPILLKTDLSAPNPHVGSSTKAATKKRASSSPNQTQTVTSPTLSSSPSIKRSSTLSAGKKKKDAPSPPKKSSRPLSRENGFSSESPPGYSPASRATSSLPTTSAQSSLLLG